jgi:hypothetical protein
MLARAHMNLTIKGVVMCAAHVVEAPSRVSTNVCVKLYGALCDRYRTLVWYTEPINFLVGHICRITYYTCIGGNTGTCAYWVLYVFYFCMYFVGIMYCPTLTGTCIRFRSVLVISESPYTLRLRNVSSTFQHTCCAVCPSAATPGPRHSRHYVYDGQSVTTCTDPTSTM